MTVFQTKECYKNWVFVFLRRLCIKPEPVRGGPREGKIQKTSFKVVKNFSRIGAAIFCSSKLVSSTARLFGSVYFMYSSYSNATEKERHNTNPLTDGIFFVDRTGLGILRDGYSDVTGPW